LPDEGEVAVEEGEDAEADHAYGEEGEGGLLGRLGDWPAGVWHWLEF
jgi:hypothetical protein